MPIFLEKTSVASYENSASVRDFVWSDSFREWKESKEENKSSFPLHKTDSFLWADEPWSLRKDEPKLLRHLFPVLEHTSQDTEYVETITFGNSRCGQTGDFKPQAYVQFDDKHAPVRPIIHWLPIRTKQVKENPLHTTYQYLCNRLGPGFLLKEAIQILYGDANGPNQKGVMCNPKVRIYNWSEGCEGDTRYDCLRRAEIISGLSAYSVDTIVLNPDDLADILREPTAEAFRAWTDANGITVFATQAMQCGDALVANIQNTSYLRNHGGHKLAFTDVHEGFFIYNKMVVKAEQYMSVVMEHPESFVYVCFDQTPAS